MVKIAPSILSADFSNLGKELERAEACGADWIHIDVMDGNFVPNITLGPCVIRDVRPYTSLPFDVHLMIMHPERFIREFSEAGADYITIHTEATENIEGTLERISAEGIGAGLSLNPSTPFEAVEPYMHLIDLLLIMTVNPGFSGQTFMHDVVPKIRQAREFIDHSGLEVELAVDGGINSDTSRIAIEAGATVLDAGSALFGCGDMGGEIEAWRRTHTM
ncbi:MAG: ribulose-phosphate 3-epimerase [Methanomassiliicoccales archaeon]